MFKILKYNFVLINLIAMDRVPTYNFSGDRH